MQGRAVPHPARHRNHVPGHGVSPGITRAPSVLWGGAGLQEWLFLQWHAHWDGIHPAHGLSMLLFPTGRRGNSVFPLQSTLQMYGLILQGLLLMRGVNEQVSLLGERGQGDKPLLVVLSFPQKMGMGLFSTPQGWVQGICSDALPTGLNPFQLPLRWLLMVHCCGARPLSWMGSTPCDHCLPPWPLWGIFRYKHKFFFSSPFLLLLCSLGTGLG